MTMPDYDDMPAPDSPDSMRERVRTGFLLSQQVGPEFGVLPASVRERERVTRQTGVGRALFGSSCEVARALGAAAGTRARSGVAGYELPAG